MKTLQKRCIPARIAVSAASGNSELPVKPVNAERPSVVCSKKSFFVTLKLDMSRYNRICFTPQHPARCVRGAAAAGNTATRNVKATRPSCDRSRRQCRGQRDVIALRSKLSLRITVRSEWRNTGINMLHKKKAFNMNVTVEAERGSLLLLWTETQGRTSDDWRKDYVSARLLSVQKD